MRLLRRLRPALALAALLLLGGPLRAEPSLLQEGLRQAREGRLPAASATLARAGRSPQVLAARARTEASRAHHEEALRLAALVHGSAEAVFDAEVTAVAALYDLDRVDEAWSRMEALEKVPRGALPAELAGRFYLQRGRMWRHRGNRDLAAKNFAEAERQARRPGASLEAGDAAASALAEWAGMLSSEAPEEARVKLREAAALAEGARAAMEVEEHRIGLDGAEGRKPEAVLAARVLAAHYGALGMPEHEGRIWSSAASLALMSGDWDLSWRLARASLERGLACRSPLLLRASLGQIVAALNMHRDPTRRAELESYFERALGLLGDPRDRIWLLVRRSDMRSRLGGDTLAGLEEARRLARRSGLPRLEVWATAALALEEFRAGRPERATDLTREAVRLARLLPPPTADDPAGLGTGLLLRRLANVLQARSRFVEAEAALRDALACDRGEERVSDRVQDWQGLLSVGLASSRMSLAQEALEEFRKELPNLPTEEHRQIAASTGLMPLLSSALWSGTQAWEDPLLPGAVQSPGAVLLRRLARQPEAMQSFLEDTRHWADRESGRGFPAIRSVALLVQGMLLEGLGRRPEAREAYATALEEARRGGFQPIQVLAAFTVARLLAQEGQEAPALEVLETTRTELAGTPMAKERSFLDRVASGLLLRMGRAEEALARADRAILDARREPPSLAYAMAARAAALSALGRRPEAATVLEEAARLAAPLPRNEGIMRMFRARALDGEEAIAEGRRARDLLRQTGAFLEERQCALELGTRLEAGERVAEALALYDEAVEGLLDWEVQIEERPPLDEAGRRLFERAVALRLARGDDEGALALLQRSGSAEVAASIDVDALGEGMEELRGRLVTLKAELRAASTAERRAEVAQELASTRQEFFTSLNALKARDSDFDRLLSVRPGDLAALQARLGPQTLLVQYYPGADALYVMALTRERYAVRRVGVDRRRLEDLVGRYRASLMAAGRPLDLEAGRLLHGFLVEPVGDLAPGRKRLHVVPGGILWYLPFDALPRPGGGFLAQDWETSTLASANVLALLQARTRPERPRVVAVAGPGLPGAAAELEAVRTAFPHAALLQGGDAGVARVREDLSGADVLHLATHGTVDPLDSNSSRLKLFDGPLRLADIYGLRLAPGSLAVLSACQTGLAEDTPGRDLASLAQGFSAAGPSTVVASLWSVDDQATAELFREFYTELARGAGRAEALRAARLRVMAGRAHPYYWAPFTLLGDGE